MYRTCGAKRTCCAAYAVCTAMAYRTCRWDGRAGRHARRGPSFLFPADVVLGPLLCIMLVRRLLFYKAALTVSSLVVPHRTLKHNSSAYSSPFRV